MSGRYGYPASDPFKVTIHKDKFREPFSWRNPRMVFVCSMGDLFHEDVPDNVINDVFNIIEAEENRKHLFLILTKRPERMNDMSARWGPGAFPNNMWMGVTAENQETYDERIYWLKCIPAEKRFVSLEPLLTPIDLKLNDIFIYPESIYQVNELLNWVIVGGESGPNARPIHSSWVESIKDQCQANEVPFFFKQWGAWIPEIQTEPGDVNPYEVDFLKDEMVYRVGKGNAGRKLYGKEYKEFPKVKEVNHDS